MVLSGPTADWKVKSSEVIGEHVFSSPPFGMKNPMRASIPRRIGLLRYGALEILDERRI